MKSILNTILIIMFLAACSYKSYDANKGDEYSEYWCDPKNIENSLLYDLSENKSNQLLTPPSMPNGCK